MSLSGHIPDDVLGLILRSGIHIFKAFGISVKISSPKIYISVELQDWVGFPLGERQRANALPDNRWDDPRLRRAHRAPRGTGRRLLSPEV